MSCKRMDSKRAEALILAEPSLGSHHASEHLMWVRELGGVDAYCRDDRREAKSRTAMKLDRSKRQADRCRAERSPSWKKIVSNAEGEGQDNYRNYH